jgi:chorismate-pyruvate lyase
MKPADPVRPALEELFAPFAVSQTGPAVGDLPEYELLPAEAVPHPFDGLLVHEHHMTVTVEGYHGDSVDVRILARAHHDPIYTRKIVLTLHRTGRVVLFGIVRVNLDCTAPEVRARIVEGKTPFGRILIEHNVLRRIEPTAFLRVHPGPAQLAWFGLQEPVPMYGRLAFIHCDNKPAVELLEIVVA